MHRMLFASVATGFSSVADFASSITVCASGCDYAFINVAIRATSHRGVNQVAATPFFERVQLDTRGKVIMLRDVVEKVSNDASTVAPLLETTPRSPWLVDPFAKTAAVSGVPMVFAAVSTMRFLQVEFERSTRASMLAEKIQPTFDTAG